MNVVDLINLTILARKGLSVISENLDPDRGEAAWKAVRAAEAVIKAVQEKEQISKTMPVEDTNVEIVQLKNSDDVKVDNNGG